MKVRKMLDTDYEAVVKMLLELYSDHSLLRPNYYDKIEAEGLTKILIESNLKIVATKNNTYLGFIRGETINLNNTKTAIIHEIFVDKNQRGNGIGNMLMQNFYEEAKLAGANRVQLQVDNRNSEAMAFWKSEGFETSHLKMQKELS